MIYEFQPRPLPSNEEYATAAEAVQHKMSIQRVNAKLYFTGFGLELNSTKDFARSAAQLASSVEPTDSATGNYADRERRRGRSIYLGALAGYSVLREIYGVALPSSSLFEYLPPVPVAFESGDSTHNINALHESIITLGDEGREIAGGETADRFSQWAEEAVMRPEFRPSFLAASGLVILAGTGMQAKRIEEFHAELIKNHVESNEEFDWDTALVHLNAKDL